MRHSFYIPSRMIILTFILAVLQPVQTYALQALIDNSSLIPSVVPDSQVKMEGMSPDWVKTLIVVQFRVETATTEGTFDAAVRVLDHYAETGVNGLWLNPIYKRSGRNNGYGNHGPNTLEPSLTGETSRWDSYAEIRHFIDEAHNRNIRIFFDIVVWGTSKDSPLVKEHPEFYGRDNGKLHEVWGGYGFDWRNKALQEWFKESAVTLIETTGADGFRVDLSPDVSGYYFKEIRDELYRKGHKIIIFSEAPSERRGTFDFEQTGVTGWTEKPDYKNPVYLKEQKNKFGKNYDYLFRTNLVDVIRSGTGIGEAALQQNRQGGLFRFYTVNLLCHDDARSFVQGNRVRFGYQVLTPFIPMWWIGEEWNNPHELTGNHSGVMYYNRIDWNSKGSPANRAFFEDVKKYIRIRRSYPDIFEYFPDSTRDANILKLTTFRDGQANSLQAYVRYREGRAIFVVPNYESPDAKSVFRIEPDFFALGFGETVDFKLTDLLTGEIQAQGRVVDFEQVETVIEAEHLGVYLLERQ